MSLILRSRAKHPKTVHVNAVDNAEITGEDEPPKPAKRRNIIARVAAVQAENQRLKEKLEKLEATYFGEVLA